MTKIVEKDNLPSDHYQATLENGSLVMKPHCACGNVLDEDYYCHECDRKCYCHQIVCDNEATLDLVKRYISKSPQFSGFKVKLTSESR